MTDPDTLAAIRRNHQALHGDTPVWKAECEVCTLLAMLDAANGEIAGAVGLLDGALERIAELEAANDTKYHLTRQAVEQQRRIAELDAANADIKKWRYSNQQDRNVINTLKGRIAELEAPRPVNEVVPHSIYMEVHTERDALRAALAEAPSYDRIQADRDVYDDWKERTRKLCDD